MAWQSTREAKQLLENERGIYYQEGKEIRVCLVYPNTYYLGMSNLGYQTVYYELNSRYDTSCERLFLPSADTSLYPWRTKVLSLESQRRTSEFAILAFSLNYEPDYVNILRVLHSGGIPLYSHERDEHHPLIIAGGICAFSNPEPVAEFIDIFVIGEAEEVIHEFMDIYHQVVSSDKEYSRDILLQELARVRGIYIPRFYDISYHSDGCIREITSNNKSPLPVEKRWIAEIDKYDTVSRIFTPHTEFGDLYLVEVMRGCGYRCRFCLAGCVYPGPRFRSLQKLKEQCEKGLKQRNKIGLVGLSPCDYPHLEELGDVVIRRGGGISLPAVRPGVTTSRVIKYLSLSGQLTVVIAPEGGSEKLRRIVGKGYLEETLLEIVAEIKAYNIPNIKLYFMIGLPGEEDDDIEAIVSLVYRVRSIMSAGKSGTATSYGQITVSVNPFIPKPFTPFQRFAMEEARVLTCRLRSLEKALAGLGNVNLISESIKWSLWQGILASGDRTLSEVLIHCALGERDWKKAFRNVGKDFNFYVHRKRSEDEILPWSHISS